MKTIFTILLLFSYGILQAQMQGIDQSIMINQVNDYALCYPGTSVSYAGNLARISQNGGGNSSTVNQVSPGSSNLAITYQKGAVFNSSSVYQTSNGLYFQNNAVSYQLGSFNLLDFRMEGDRNVLNTLQFGDINDIGVNSLSSENVFLESIQIAFRNEVSVVNLNDRQQNITVRSRNKNIDNLLLVDLVKYGEVIEHRIHKNGKEGALDFNSGENTVYAQAEGNSINLKEYSSFNQESVNKQELSVFRDGRITVIPAGNYRDQQLITFLHHGNPEDIDISIDKDNSEVTIAAGGKEEQIFTANYDGKPVIWIRQIASEDNNIDNSASEIMDLIITLTEVEQIDATAKIF